MTKQYNANSIQILEGLDPVRKRPGMYIGSTGSKGLHHLIYEVLDNSIDEHLAGFCNKITVKLNKEGSVTIRDYGRGIPVDLHGNTLDYPKSKYPKGVSSLRLVLTVLHAGGKFDNDAYKVSGGLHGVGISVVNALSSSLVVRVYKDGLIYEDSFKEGGQPINELKNGMVKVVGKTKETGTEVTFTPDETIFDSIKFNPDTVKAKIKELSYLNKDLEITFINEQLEEKEEIVYREKEGIVGFIKDLNTDKSLVSKDIIYFKDMSNDIEVEVAIQYVNEYGENMFSFCNNINTQEGGTHVSGFRSALTRTMNKYAKEDNIFSKKNDTFDGKDTRTGLVAILSIKHKDPQFEGQTKTKLGNNDARKAVDDVVSSQLELFFDRNRDVLDKVLKNMHKAFKLRHTEAKAREELLGRKKQFTASSKLSSCRKKLNPKKGVLTELFIVEGDSAGGSAKQGRNRDFQAILSLKGKPLNTEKSTLTKMLSNQEIADIIAALGTGFSEGLGEDFDINKLRYDKIIIMTDADVDGSHIRTLLLTFFYRHMPELILEGKVYCAVPPLYKISHGKKEEYLYSDKELEEYTSKLKTNYTIQRYKGLGEMNPDQLWETTMNPAARVLNRVQIDSSVTADKVTGVLMGSTVGPRRQFIEDNANKAEINI